MSLTGDLSTLDLGDLIQNLETHQRTGILSIEEERGTAHVYFRAGKLALFGREGRPSLMRTLVASEAISPTDLEAARKKRKRTRKSLTEVLVGAGKLDEDEVRSIAADRLLDEACELIATAAGAFTFTQGSIPRGVFDPEERRLELGLAAGPLLLEAARRQDHWRLIRERVPSDSIHYIVQRQPSGEQGELATVLLERLDGSRCVSEAVACFPHRRFEAYQALADLVEARVLRAAGAEDLGRMAKELSRHDLARAWEVLLRALEAHPQNVGLLSEQVSLAALLDHADVAGEALKLLVHLHLEADERDLAQEELERARSLDPDGLWVWERSFALASEDGRVDDAVRDGLRLAELYRRPGLHQKAAAVLEQLLVYRPEDWELRLEYARSLADCGDLPGAFAELDRFGRKLIGAEDYLRAHAVYEEALRLEPKNAAAQEMLERLQSGLLERRRARMRRIVRWVAASVVAVLMTLLVGFEIAARRAYQAAARTISREQMIEFGRYAEAIDLYRAVSLEYPSTTTSLYDVPERIEDLRQKLIDAEE